MTFNHYHHRCYDDREGAWRGGYWMSPNMFTCSPSNNARAGQTRPHLLLILLQYQEKQDNQELELLKSMVEICFILAVKRMVN